MTPEDRAWVQSLHEKLHAQGLLLNAERSAQRATHEQVKVLSAQIVQLLPYNLLAAVVGQVFAEIAAGGEEPKRRLNEMLAHLEGSFEGAIARSDEPQHKGTLALRGMIEQVVSAAEDRLPEILER